MEDEVTNGCLELGSILAFCFPCFILKGRIGAKKNLGLKEEGGVQASAKTRSRRRSWNVFGEPGAYGALLSTTDKDLISKWNSLPAF